MAQSGVSSGIKCSVDLDALPPTNSPIIINPDYVPTCEKDNYIFYADTDISGGNLQVVITSDPKLCCVACDSNALCNSWVIFAGTCYLKSGTQKIFKDGCKSGKSILYNNYEKTKL